MQPTPPPREPLRLVYIAGSGRSGSTVLATILGSHPDIVNLGELERLPRDGWTRNRYCSCGRRALACPFWSEVRQRWLSAVPDADADELLSLQDRFTDRTGLLRHLTPGAGGGRGFRRYAELTGALLECTLDASGARVAVDSSKRPARALALARVPGVDLRILHLVRDGRGVLCSLRQAYEKNEKKGIERPIRPKPTWRVAALWTFANLSAEYACRHVDDGHSELLRYEHLVQNPVSALARIGDLADLDLGFLGKRAARGGSFDAGHAIAGNRVRMQEEIRLRPDREWHERLAERNRHLFWLLAGLVMRRYGYARES